MFDTILKAMGWRKLTPDEMRAKLREDAERHLVDAEQLSEHYAHQVALYKARIKRLNRK